MAAIRADRFRHVPVAFLRSPAANLVDEQRLFDFHTNEPSRETLLATLFIGGYLRSSDKLLETLP